jgi:alanine dehydrogenase
MNTPDPVLLLNRETVSSLLTLEECITAVESAFAAHAQHRTLSTGLIHIDADHGEFHIKAGGLRGRRTYFACKINGGFFTNQSRVGLPNILGLILLCDGTTGVPLAVMESGLVTRLRTGAATAVAARYLAKADSHNVTICGAGIQADIQLRALKCVLPIQRAYVWARSGAQAFADRLSAELKLDVRTTPDLATATWDSDVIVTCTPAKAWFLGCRHVQPGTFVAAVGADSPTKQELEPQLLAESSVVCDLTEQCAHVGELHHAIGAGLMTAERVRGELGDVIAGKARKREQGVETIIFDSTGTALQDAAAAACVYERAVLAGSSRTFSFWGTA